MAKKKFEAQKSASAKQKQKKPAPKNTPTKKEKPTPRKKALATLKEKRRGGPKAAKSPIAKPMAITAKVKSVAKTFYRETSYLRAFPDAADVFANRVKEHAEYLLPVATLSLKHLSRQWDGQIHFVMPIEPCSGYGYPGEKSTPYHNSLCRPNWIGYRMLGKKCEIDGDFRFFHKAYYSENPPQSDLGKREAAELDAHYSRTRQEFKRHADFFNQHGWLCQSPENWTGLKKDQEWMRVSLVRDLGGVSFGGNWSSSQDFPMSRYPDQREDRGKVYDTERVLPQTQDGRDFYYVGEVEMWNYIGDTNGVLVLFFDPRERVVLTTIDWT